MKPVWVKATIVVVVVAFVATGAAALFSAAGNQQSSAPATQSPSAAPSTSGYLTPTADSGPAAAVAELKRVLPQLLTDAVAVQRLPAKPAARKALIADPKATAERRAAVARVWAPPMRRDVAAQLESALAQVGADPGYHSFDDNRFVVKDWQGVLVQGARASVLVLGHQQFRLGVEAWQADPERQYQVALQRQPNGHWQLAGVRAVASPDGRT